LCCCPTICLHLQIAHRKGRHRLAKERGEYTVDAPAAFRPTLEPVALLPGIEIKQSSQRTDSVAGLLTAQPLASSVCHRISTLGGLCGVVEVANPHMPPQGWPTPEHHRQ